VKRLAKLWDFYFVAGLGFFVCAVMLADQAAVPLVVLAFNAGLWLAHWVSDLQREQLLEALTHTRAMCDQQDKLIKAMHKHITDGGEQ